MNTENNQMGWKQTLVPILATVGVGLVVAAVVSILGVAWPWLMLIAGIVLIIIAVFLSIPSTVNWLSPIRMYKLLQRAYLWKLYGPRYTINDPTIEDSEILEHPSGVRYTANVRLSVRNRDIYPLGVNVDPLRVYLEQKSGWKKLFVTLENHTGTGDIELSSKDTPNDRREFQVVVNKNCIGDPKYWPNCPKNHYGFGIWGIHVTFRGNMRELHKGIYHKHIKLPEIH